ncbi:hypothetical protein Tco_1501227 [Tanacetum coccineum]
MAPLSRERCSDFNGIVRVRALNILSSCGVPLEDGVRCQRCTCKWCGYGLREGFCLFCASRDGNSYIDAPNPNSFNDPPNVFIHPSQPQYESYSCELCGNIAHYGFDCPPRDSLIMGDEDLSTIPEKESDKVIKSSVEDLVQIPSESEDTSESDNVPKDNVKIYSNPLFEFDDEYISSDVNPLFNKILEDIESEDSYVSKLDEPDLLVTPLSKLNEDEWGDILLLEKLLNNDPTSPLPPKELNFEELKVIKYDVSTDFEDDYYDSEGDIIYLESLLIKDTIHNLPPEVFLDHDPRSLKDELDKDDLKNIVKDCPDYEDSRARGFVHRSLDLQSIACLYMGIRLDPFVEIPSGESKVHIEVLSVLWGNRLPIPDGSLPLSR